MRKKPIYCKIHTKFYVFNNMVKIIEDFKFFKIKHLRNAKKTKLVEGVKQFE